MALKDFFTNKHDNSSFYFTNGYELETGLKRYFSEEEIKKIASKKIFIAGCGGLGSNVAHMLVRSGFRKITILDFDVVEDSNLNRQLYFPDQIGMKKTEALAQTLLRLEPDLEITSIVGKIESPSDVSILVNDSDIIVEAFDSPTSKATFVSGALPTGKIVIAVSGIAGYGNTNDIITKKMGNNFYLIGDEKTGIDSAAPLSPRVMIAAAKQADLVLELTLNEGSAVY